MSKCAKKILGFIALIGVVSLIATGLVLFFRQEQNLDDDFDDDFDDDLEEDFGDSDFELDDLADSEPQNREYVSLGKSGSGPNPVPSGEPDSSGDVSETDTDTPDSDE